MSDKSNIFEYPGDHVDVSWDKRLCIHVGECGRADGPLFTGGRDPWCDPNVAGSAAEVAEVCERCPTGALTYLRKDGGEVERAPARNQVVVSNDGPLYFTGDLQIAGAAQDMGGVRFRAALCRCGRSANKPFCDNSHRAASDGVEPFHDAGAVGSTGDASITEGGPLEVKRVPNGPLLVNGSFTIVTGAGRVAWRGTRHALCRCGASNNKPFCDGSHKAAGFVAE
ncbi:hypothetical protein DB30_00129 [Enhygromyxa salina]|uniref:Iron-binding zinc finger CDGSH type domain-containing protein n=1 Tax=Enhygromyxa salina TaxID=215803 RepID=A0A0C2DDV1_9BACT|nr:CDGSH iron-sulfur domain-containing protein [Enhygromyxa salina]KIG19620.1 hypothetical protein DB30_00129 [Enhygromyxa salina]